MPADPLPARATPRSSGGLRVRHEAGLLARAAFDVAEALPRGSRGDLADQLRRAATSVYANLAEGEGRASTADRLRCFTIAWGSLLELNALLDLSEYVASATGDHTTRAHAHARQVGRLLLALRRTLAASRAPATTRSTHAPSKAPSQKRPIKSAPPSAPPPDRLPQHP